MGISHAKQFVFHKDATGIEIINIYYIGGVTNIYYLGGVTNIYYIGGVTIPAIG